jgi:GT2 family glycosyltransferase
VTEPLAEEVRRLQSELARVQADSQRRTQEAAVLQLSAAWAFVLRCHKWRVRLIPPHSRREAAYKKVLSVLFRWIRPSGRQPSDPAPPRRSGDGPVSPEAQATKDTFARLWRSELSSFLATGHTLRLPRHEPPLVSVVVVVYNRADLTFQCLRSLAVNADVAFELIVVDNASSDETVALLDRMDPITVIRNDTNLHFLRGCNQAARVARGEYLLFLNNDACLLPGSLAAAVRTMSSSPDIGTVGAKLVLLDGTLQEAGSIVWGDGSCLGYGRGDSPLAAPYMFQRDVSYASGAFLLTRRDLFADEGGFDERFAPAYYEEVDYCMRLWQAGKRSVYDPQVVAYHFEFGSSASPDSAIDLQLLNRSQFAEKHAPALASLPPGNSSVIAARSAQDRRRVLMVDDRVPHQALGSGFPRSRAILQSMVSEGLRVTFYPMTMAEEGWPSVYQDIPRTVEVILRSGVEGLEAFLHERSGYYDVILVSRPHNMEVFQRVWAAHPEWLSNARVVYDAEAIFALREIARREVLGNALTDSEAERLIAAEVSLARGADTLVCVTGREAAFFSRRGAPNVVVLGHAVDVRPTVAEFADREHLLFVGAIHEDGSPNEDSLLWFADQVLPRIREALAGVELYVAGINASAAVARLAGRGVRLLGPVDDLEPVYGARRLFVAPTRFSAGLPIKVCEAAAHGLPVVATPLLASQLGWQPGRELLVGDTAAGFADACMELYRDRVLWQEVRANALKQVETQCSRTAFSAVVARLCADGPPARAGETARVSVSSGR